MFFMLLTMHITCDSRLQRCKCLGANQYLWNMRNCAYKLSILLRFLTFCQCLLDSQVLYFDCNILAMCAVQSSRLGFIVVLYVQVIAYIQDINLKVYSFRVYCFRLENWHTPWHHAGINLNIVALFYGSTAVSVFTTAARGFPADGSGCRSDCPQQVVILLAATPAATIVCGFIMMSFRLHFLY